MKTTGKQRSNESGESRALIQHAFVLARELSIDKILIQGDEFHDQRWVRQQQRDEILIWLSHREKALPQVDGKTNFAVTLPGQKLSRMDQIQIGLMMSVSEGYVAPDETILTLTGLVGSQRLDNLLITNPRRDHPWLRDRSLGELEGKLLRSKEFFKLLEIALRFAQEGREGRAIGTTFVLGDVSDLDPYLRQLILNPCKGHPQRLRNIHSRHFLEVLRELAALDGAFIVNLRGVVERAGSYLTPPSLRPNVRMRAGRGARHASACSITAACDVLAIVLSQSSASVTVYYRGSAILELNQRR